MPIPKSGEKHTKRTFALIEVVLENLSQGMPLIRACKDAGLGRQSFYEWLNESEENEQRYYSALRGREALVVDAVFKTALEGNTTAQRYWLNNRSPKYWRERTETIHGGSVTYKEKIRSKEEIIEHLKEIKKRVKK